MRLTPHDACAPCELRRPPPAFVLGTAGVGYNPVAAGGAENKKRSKSGGAIEGITQIFDRRRLEIDSSAPPTHGTSERNPTEVQSETESDRIPGNL